MLHFWNRLLFVVWFSTSFLHHRATKGSGSSLHVQWCEPTTGRHRRCRHMCSEEQHVQIRDFRWVSVFPYVMSTDQCILFSFGRICIVSLIYQVLRAVYWAGVRVTHVLVFCAGVSLSITVFVIASVLGSGWPMGTTFKCIWWDAARNWTCM